VKCDLCRGYDGPAGVQACPTGSIFRCNPAEKIADVRALLRRRDAAPASEARAGPGPRAVGSAAGSVDEGAEVGGMEGPVGGWVARVLAGGVRSCKRTCTRVARRRVSSALIHSARVRIAT
jgi:hypothetical protein